MTNPIALDFIKAHEGCRLTAYRDSVGVLTIGVGHTGPDVFDGLAWTQEQADSALSADIDRFAASVGAHVEIPLSEPQSAALISFAFNLGAAALAGSTLLQRVNASDFFGAVREWIRWDHAGQGEVKGLLIRRLEEAALFLRGS